MVDASRSFRPSRRGVSDADIGPIAGAIVGNRVRRYRFEDRPKETSKLHRCDSCLCALQNALSTLDPAILHLCAGAQETEIDSFNCCAYK